LTIGGPEGGKKGRGRGKLRGGRRSVRGRNFRPNGVTKASRGKKKKKVAKGSDGTNK